MSAIDQPRYVLLGLWRVVWWTITHAWWVVWYVVLGFLPWLLFALAALGGDHVKRVWIDVESDPQYKTDQLFVWWTLWAIVNGLTLGGVLIKIGWL